MVSVFAIMIAVCAFGFVLGYFYNRFEVIAARRALVDQRIKFEADLSRATEVLEDFEEIFDEMERFHSSHETAVVLPFKPPVV